MEKKILPFLGTVLCVWVMMSVNSIMTREELLCSLKKNVPFSTITREQASKDGNATILPEESLEKLVHFNSCAVVSSSHGLRLHKYGKVIDSHDAVLRFNCAPTQGFEQFVGNRTDIRLINTQIPARYFKKDFWSKNRNMFRHETIVVRNMDSISVKEDKIDTKGDDFHVFANLVKYKKMYPTRDLHFIQRPDFGKDIRRELRWFCTTTGMCKKTIMSPSSGMFGVVMMLHLCDWVRVYEIVPSNKDRTRLRYYYDKKALVPKHFIYHSYINERIYLRTLSLTTEKDINETGVVLLKGTYEKECGKVKHTALPAPCCSALHNCVSPEGYEMEISAPPYARARARQTVFFFIANSDS
ncbi:beta-galactoside alpha-2,6-sialyltransferase [Branchiostoma belcheri]|nr:beta-galactoside alpha-2,6-sialyltransferase [Branchiostoma belcheri]